MLQSLRSTDVSIGHPLNIDLIFVTCGILHLLKSTVVSLGRLLNIQYMLVSSGKEAYERSIVSTFSQSHLFESLANAPMNILSQPLKTVPYSQVICLTFLFDL